MKAHYFAVILSAFAGVYATIDAAVSSLDIWQILDKYGFPTAALALACIFIWNRQKKADNERNDLISTNNDLMHQLINAVKAGNACPYIQSKKGEN